MVNSRFIYDHLRRVSLWPRRIISHSKWCDRVKERPVVESAYIDEDFLKNQIKRQRGSCFYCKYKMQVFNRKLHNGLTVERLDMAKPHTKENTVLCCSACNCRRFTQESLTKPRTKKYLRKRKKRALAISEIHDEIRKFDSSRRGVFVR